MSFQETYEAYLAELDKAPCAPPMTEKVQKGGTLKYMERGKRQTRKMRDTTYHVPASHKAHQQHVKDVSAFRATVKTCFFALSSNDRRKLSALYNAGATSSSVRTQYAALPDGSSIGALANAAALRAGMERALQEEISLDAASW